MASVVAEPTKAPACRGGKGMKGMKSKKSKKSKKSMKSKGKGMEYMPEKKVPYGHGMDKLQVRRLSVERDTGNDVVYYDEEECVESGKGGKGSTYYMIGSGRI